MPGQTKITPRMQEIYKADFAKFDANGNGALDGEECKTMAKFQLKPGASDDDLAALIAEMDTNKDGKIELAEYMDKILGKGWVCAAEDAEGNEYKCGRTECPMKEVVEAAQKVYDEMKLIPLVCATTEEKATALSTFWNYAGGCTVFDTKMLVGLAMNEGKPAAWDRLKQSAEGCMKAPGNGNTLVLHGRDGAADLCGIAKECGGDAEKTLKALFDPKTEHDHTNFPAFDGLEVGDIKPEHRMVVVTEFLAEDVCDFLQWGQIPLEQCHLVVVTEE